MSQAQSNGLASAGQSHTFPIVGIGASAGGIDAFRRLLRNLPANSGMAFVYIQHLDPAHESMLAEIFARETSMRVLEAAAGASVSPDELYVIPPNANLTIQAGHLVITRRTLPPGHHLPIDDFLRSLADEHPSRGIAVVLSGASSDGALGLQAVKQSGGITFAQDSSAQHSTMPHHAINTGAVDFILSPEEIGAELGRIARRPYFLSTRRQLADVFPRESNSELRTILDVVHETKKIDFSQYRTTTLKRRVARRMSVCRVKRIEDYVSVLRSDASEVDALVNEMLIKVTSFFRDPDLFRALSNLVWPRLVGLRRADEEIRLWVPACATGEEVYSLAISLIEWRSSHSLESPIRIFGTDLSQTAIDHARRGMYVENICMDVSPERLTQFFHKVEDHYQINKVVRDMCVFARHDVTQDPPFSKMDLASCRNLLIYMSAPLQRLVMERLHYSLNPEATLVLGGSESMLGHSDLFVPLDKTQRLFRKVAIPTPARQLRRDKLSGSAALKSQAEREAASEAAMIEEADRISVRQSDHSGVVVDASGRILQFRGEMARFLAPGHGRATLDILKMVPEEIRLPLGAALREATQTGHPVHREELPFRRGDGYEAVCLDVLPLRLPGVEKHHLILFQTADAREVETAVAFDAEESRRQITRLEQQLAAATDYLHSVIEELKASNEEVQSNNEELQSVNEEIETGKEELQSGNEELSTVNEQLQASNISLNQSNADLRNLLASVPFAIVILGSDLRIRMFTPSATGVLNFIASDVGRDFGHIRTNLLLEDLPAQVRQCVEAGTAIEMEVADRAGNWYLMRITPSRDHDTNVEGVILTLIDIGNRKRVEEERERLVSELRRGQAQLARLVEHMPSALIVAEAPSGRVILTNQHTNELFGHAVVNGRSADAIPISAFHPDGTPYSDADWPLTRALRLGEIVKDETMELVGPDGKRLSLRVNAAPIREPSGAIALALALFDEITDVESLRDRLAHTEQLAQSQRLETIGRLAGGVAHDFNNLLTVIIGFSQFVRDDQTLSPHLYPQLDTVIQSANRAATLTSQLLAFSRRQPIQPRETDLNLLVSRVAGMLQRLVPEHIQLQVELAVEPCIVMADVVQMEQIVMNLVSNAVDAIDKRGEIVVRTGRTMRETSSGEHTTLACLSVEDDGRGMTEEVREHIFEPFFTTKEFGRGTGLGLASVFGTVQQHNGDIRVDSSPGRGTRIEVLLPCLTGAEATSLPQRSQTQRGSETILLVEDEDGVRAMARMCLESLGYTVIEAEDGKEALLRYTEHPGVIDMLVTDVVMPEMHGGELMERLRVLQPGIRVAFMSGYPQDVVGEHGTMRRDVHFIQKPFTIQELGRVVRDALDTRSSENTYVA